MVEPKSSVMIRSLPYLTAGLVVSLLPAMAGSDAKTPVSSSSSGGWEYSISAGPAYRNLGNLRIDSGYRSGGLVIPSLVGSNSLTTPPIGTTDAPGDRDYNDGFVHQDPGTGSDGDTWNWGYNNSSQVQGGQMVYTATGAQSIRSDILNAPLSGPDSKRNLEGIAPHLQFDARSPRYFGPFRLGFTAALDYTGVNKSLEFSNFSLTQIRDDYRLDYIDRYNLNGVIPPLPPYAGSYDGPGPLLGNTPDSRDVTPVLIGTQTAHFSNDVHSSIDLDTFSFTLGPTLSLDKGRFDFAVSAGLMLNIYNWKAKQEESLYVTTASGTSEYAHWSESDSGVKFRPGVYLQGEAAYELQQNLGVSGFLRLDVAQDFSVKAGPTNFNIDPYGVTAGLQIRYTLP